MASWRRPGRSERFAGIIPPDIVPNDVMGAGMSGAVDNAAATGDATWAIVDDPVVAPGRFMLAAERATARQLATDGGAAGPSGDDSAGLSTGAKVGIAAGVVALVGAGAWAWSRKKRR